MFFSLFDSISYGIYIFNSKTYMSIVYCSQEENVVFKKKKPWSSSFEKNGLYFGSYPKKRKILCIALGGF